MSRNFARSNKTASITKIYLILLQCVRYNLGTKTLKILLAPKMKQNFNSISVISKSHRLLTKRENLTNISPKRRF